MPSIQNLASFIMVRPLLCSWPTKGDAMRRFVLMLGWVLWAHEMAVVGDKLLDRGYTAIDSFETRQQCNTAMADYASLNAGVQRPEAGATDDERHREADGEPVSLDTRGTRVLSVWKSQVRIHHLQQPGVVGQSPPVTSTVTPVTKSASDEARKQITRA
jgi:hypothetical protein